MTKSSSNNNSAQQVQDSNLFQNYQSIFSSVSNLEKNLYDLLNSFNLLTKEEQNKLFLELENFQTNLHLFSEFFGVKSPNKSVVRTSKSKFLCVQEGNKLVIRVMNYGKVDKDNYL